MIVAEPIAPAVQAIAESFLVEFEAQARLTRRFLERLPEDKLTWKPHERSMTAGQLAFHIASLPGGIVRFVIHNPMQAPAAFQFPQPASRQEVVGKFEESIATVREILPAFDDAAMSETLHLYAGDRELMALPRFVFLRDLMFSHWYQHRGQFSVYLRLLDIPVPATWGPSADEPPPFLSNTQPA